MKLTEKAIRAMGILAKEGAVEEPGKPLPVLTELVDAGFAVRGAERPLYEHGNVHTVVDVELTDAGRAALAAQEETK